MKVLEFKVLEGQNGDPQAVRVTVQRDMDGTWYDESSLVVESTDEDAVRRLSLEENQRVIIDHLGATQVVFDKEQNLATRAPRDSKAGEQWKVRHEKRMDQRNKDVVRVEEKNLSDLRESIGQPRPLSSEELAVREDVKSREEALKELKKQTNVGPGDASPKGQTQANQPAETNQATTSKEGQKPAATSQHPAGDHRLGGERAVNVASPSMAPKSNMSGLKGTKDGE